MQTVKALRGNARTFLTHIFGRGLDDDRYVVERFQSMADGEIRPRRGDWPTTKGRRKAPRKTVSLQAVQRIRPERDEIIVCTGISIAGGIQYWGDYAVWGHMLRRR